MKEFRLITNEQALKLLKGELFRRKGEMHIVDFRRLREKYEHTYRDSCGCSRTTVHAVLRRDWDNQTMVIEGDRVRMFDRSIDTESITVGEAHLDAARSFATAPV